MTISPPKRLRHAERGERLWDAVTRWLAQIAGCFWVSPRGPSFWRLMNFGPLSGRFRGGTRRGKFLRVFDQVSQWFVIRVYGKGQLGGWIDLGGIWWYAFSGDYRISVTINIACLCSLLLRMKFILASYKDYKVYTRIVMVSPQSSLSGFCRQMELRARFPKRTWIHIVQKNQRVLKGSTYIPYTHFSRVTRHPSRSRDIITKKT